MSCSYDTNRDGNCGRPLCPECGAHPQAARQPFTTTTSTGPGLTLADVQRAYDSMPKPPWAAFLGVSVELRQTEYAPDDDQIFVLDLRDIPRETLLNTSPPIPRLREPDFVVVIHPQVFAKLPVELTSMPHRKMLAVMLWMADESHKRKQAARRPEPPIRIIKEY